MDTAHADRHAVESAEAELVAAGPAATAHPPAGSIVAHDVGEQPHVARPKNGPANRPLELGAVAGPPAGEHMAVARDHHLERPQVFVIDIDGTRAAVFRAEPAFERPLRLRVLPLVGSLGSGRSFSESHRSTYFLRRCVNRGLTPRAAVQPGNSQLDSKSSTIAYQGDWRMYRVLGHQTGIDRRVTSLRDRMPPSSPQTDAPVHGRKCRSLASLIAGLLSLRVPHPLILSRRAAMLGRIAPFPRCPMAVPAWLVRLRPSLIAAALAAGLGLA